MPAYASRDALAAALRIAVTPANSDLLDVCLEAAAEEIDAFLDRPAGEPLPEPAPAAVVRCNINRAVEWWKAPDAAQGQVGTTTTGTLSSPPDGFGRHAGTILQLKLAWGVA